MSYSPNEIFTRHGELASAYVEPWILKIYLQILYNLSCTTNKEVLPVLLLLFSEFVGENTEAMPAHLATLVVEVERLVSKAINQQVK